MMMRWAIILYSYTGRFGESKTGHRAIGPAAAGLLIVYDQFRAQRQNSKPLRAQNTSCSIKSKTMVSLFSFFFVSSPLGLRYRRHARPRTSSDFSPFCARHEPAILFHICE